MTFELYNQTSLIKYASLQAYAAEELYFIPEFTFTLDTN